MPYLKAGYFIDEVYDHLVKLVGEPVLNEFYEKNLPFKADGFPKKLRISGAYPLIKVAWNIKTRGRPTRASLSLSKHILDSYLNEDRDEEPEHEAVSETVVEAESEEEMETGSDTDPVTESEVISVNHEGSRTRLEFNWPELESLEKDPLNQLLTQFHKISEKEVAQIFGEPYLTLFHILKDLQTSAQVQQLILLMYLAYYPDQEFFVNIKGVKDSLATAIVADLNELFEQLNRLISKSEKPLKFIVNEESIKAHTVLYESDPQPGFRITSITGKVDKEKESRIPYMLKVFTDRRVEYSPLGDIIEVAEEDIPEDITEEKPVTEVEEEAAVSDTESESEEVPADTEEEVAGEEGEEAEAVKKSAEEESEEEEGIERTEELASEKEEALISFAYKDEKQKEALLYFLRNIFRVSEFRPVQEVIMNRIFQNSGVLAMLPAGAGKSLPYQLCGLLQPGITVIVEPTRALMENQSYGLFSNGITNTLTLHTLSNFAERREKLNTLLRSENQFVYLTPDWLHKKDLIRVLKESEKFGFYFSYAVVDEAHCVSEWGHDFRYSYVEVAKYLKRLCKPKDQDLIFYGLSAPATLDVLNDIQRELGFSKDSLISFPAETMNRKGLKLSIVKLDNNLNEQVSGDLTARVQAIGSVKHVELMKSLHSLPSLFEQQEADAGFFEQDETGSYSNTGLIFCPTDSAELLNGTHAVKESLEAGMNQLNIAVLNGDEGSDQADFYRNNNNLMIATHEYGIGVDNPNIRYSYHYTFPNTIESFYQETGRAGRDGRPAQSVILYHPEDIRTKYDHYEQSAEAFIREKEIIGELLTEVHYEEGFNLRIIAQKAMLKFPEIGKVDLVDQKYLILLGAGNRGTEEQVQIASVELQNNLKLDAEFIQNFDKVKSAEIGRYVIGLLRKEADGKNPLDWLNTRTGPGIVPRLKKNPKDTHSLLVQLNNAQDDILRALYRLSAVGIIDDYVVNDVVGYVKVEFESKKDEFYLTEFRNYLKRYFGNGSAEKWIEKTRSKDMSTALESVIFTFIEFMEQEIFKRKKRSFDHMKQLCEIGFEQGKEAFEDLAVSYFTSKYSGDHYLPKDTEGGKLESAEIVKKYLGYINNPPDGQGGELTNSMHLRNACEHFRSTVTEDNASVNLLTAYSYFTQDVQEGADVETILNNPVVQKAIELYTHGFKTLEEKEPWIEMVQLIGLFSTKVLDLNPGLKPYLVPLVDKILIHRTSSRLKKFLNKIYSHE